MTKLCEEHVTIASAMVAREVPVRRVAAQLGVDESTIRYRLARAPGTPTAGSRRRPARIARPAARIQIACPSRSIPGTTS